MIIDDLYINYNISFITSRYSATGDAITTIAYNFQIGVSIARQIILDVCTAIWDVLAPIYMPVPSEDKWKSIADEFYEGQNFPNCIGTIDCKHVMIQCPINSGSLLSNYKSYFSIVLLAIASADYRFVMVNVGAYGSSNDSSVLNHKTFFKWLRNKNLDVPPSKELPNDIEETHVHHILLGDQAFPLRYDLMRPFVRNSLTNERSIFNYRLSRARRVVENAFSILANCWRIYHCIYLNLDNVTTVVKATVVLHNIMTLPNDKVCTDVMNNRVKTFGDAFEDPAKQGNWPATAANDIWNYFTHYFNSDHGSVEWQNNYP